MEFFEGKISGQTFSFFGMLVLGIITSIGVFVRVSSYFYLIVGILLVLFGINNLKSISEMVGYHVQFL